MKRSPVLSAALCALLLSNLSCKLLDTEDGEGAVGRGARAFDPYQVDSGAIRLSLQMFNGCSVLPSGQGVQKGTANIPSYPATCPNFNSGNPAGTPVAPNGRFEILTGGTYFLNQLTLAESTVSFDPLTGGKANPPPMSDVIRWMKTQSRFKKLDWGNLSRSGEEWIFNPGPPGVGRDQWQRELRVDGANWRKVTNDTFTLEFLDAEGTVRGEPVTYSREDFMGESVHGGHSRMGLRIENITPPRFPGDEEPHPMPALQGYNPPFPPILYRSIIRMDVVGNVNPAAKTFQVPELDGDGSIRVTWSQMPDDPFYFPVTYLSSDEIAPSCTNDSGEPVPCGFGVDPRLHLGKPANGKYFEPGETLQVVMDIRDGNGNRLHSPDLLPSGAEAASGKTNGINYPVLQYFFAFFERDTFPAFMIAGPIDKMTTRSDPTQKAPVWIPHENPRPIVNDLAVTRTFPGEFESLWPTRQSYPLSKTAEPGTYVALFKINRNFMGERMAKTNAYFFQVGQEQPTSYPGEVGNCQLCHRGPLSLDNLRHGLSVDHVESCKICHMRQTDFIPRMQVKLHQLHMESPRYMADRKDCTMCHLKRESALRPSVNVCSSCHAGMHGNEFFDTEFVLATEANRYGSCAQTCHVETAPKNHILPDN